MNKMKNKKNKTLARVLSALMVAVPAALVLYLSDMGYAFHEPGSSMLKLSIKHPGKRIVECDDMAILAAEAEKYREMLRETKQARMKLKKLGECSRERHPVYVEIVVDGEVVSTRSYEPAGWKKDGPSYAYLTLPLEPGSHRVEVKMKDSGRDEGFDYILTEGLDFIEGRITVVEFSDAERRLRVR